MFFGVQHLGKILFFFKLLLIHNKLNGNHSCIIKERSQGNYINNILRLKIANKDF